MNQNRINIFNPVHKGLRALLYQTALHIQQTDFTNEDEAEETLRQVETVVHLFKDHAHNEDHFILPAIARFDNNISALFKAEHEEDERLSCVLSASVSAWRETDEDAVKAAAGQILFYHFNAFVAFNLYHMNKEETVLNTALWAHFSDEEIVGILQGILASVPPQVKGIQSCWMLRGMNNAEITNWLRKMKQEAPPEVFCLHTKMAEEELHPVRWNTICVSLSENVMAN